MPVTERIPASEQVAPYQLVLEPTEEARSMYEDASYYYDDTRDILGSTPAGMDLYEIYVYGEPGGCREHLGTLRVTTRMSASQWGDYRLFFQHAVAGQSPRYVPSALTCGLEHR